MKVFLTKMRRLTDSFESVHADNDNVRLRDECDTMKREYYPLFERLLLYALRQCDDAEAVEERTAVADVMVLLKEIVTTTHDAIARAQCHRKCEKEKDTEDLQVHEAVSAWPANLMASHN